MKIVEMVMPQMGESILECTVLTLLKNVGEKVETDDSVMEVATDKVDTEVPSRYSGTIKEWVVKVGDVVAIGGVIARIEIEDSKEEEETEEINEVVEQLESEILQVSVTHVGSSVHSGEGSDQNNGFYSPLVLSMARAEGISQTELQQITGTGLEGRVTKHDMQLYLDNRKKVVPAATPVTAPKPTDFATTGAVEIVEMDRMRKMIAERMVQSKHVAPHVTSFIETDMTTVVKWRESIKHKFMEANGHGITFTPILVQAVVKALKDFPMINVSVDGDKIIVKKDINVGIAVALPNGNLIVPVIHRADQYNLNGLSLKINDIVKRARANKLTADDLSNGTYTISNIGTFGNIMGTPIILQPQVAIMAFGAIQKKPAVVETPSGDFIGIRNKMFISHSYDHRVVDGSLGGMFLKKVSDYLEEFDAHTSVV